MKTGFNAMGLAVPENRLQKGYNAVKQMLPDADKYIVFRIVSKCANKIRRDEPFAIIGAVYNLDKDLDKLDVIGRYRLLAEMLTD